MVLIAIGCPFFTRDRKHVGAMLNEYIWPVVYIQGASLMTRNGLFPHSYTATPRVMHRIIKAKP